MTLILAATVAVLYATGTYLLLQRSLTRIVIGLAMMGHGANLLLLMAGGQPGLPPLIGADGQPPAGVADPLPQAMALTAVVITFGIMAFLLALAYRSWLGNRNDEVEDDLEDRSIARGARTVHDEDPEVVGAAHVGPGDYRVEAVEAVDEERT